MTEFNPILSGTRTPEGIKKRLEDARQQLLQGPDAGIQCVIFDKTYYNDEKAREWLRYNGFKTNYEPMILCNPHITEDYFSYMQFDVQPRHLQRDIFTSITPKEGIELLIYCKK